MNGCVDLSPFYGDIPANWPNVAKAVRTSLKKTFDDVVLVPFVDFIQKTMSLKLLAPLYSQTLLELAIHIERTCGSHATKSAASFGQLRFEWSHWHELIDQPSTRSRQLVAYVANSHTPLRNHAIMGMASDKAHPGNLPIANAVLTTPNNFAVVCCPNVFPPSIW